MKRADFIFGISGLVLTGYVWVVAGGFPEDQVVQIGPAFFPRILAVGLGLSSLTLIFQAVVQRHRQSVPEQGPRFSLRDPGIQRAGITLTATAVYCLLLETLGFIPLSILYLLLLMLLLKEKKYLQMVLTAISVTGVLYLIFNVFLNITLPLGSLYGF